ncbi:hypothetical protein U5U50_01635 [Mycoplasma sp. 888]|nr:hypothetical protein [Mycoplasma sp. 888]WRQ26084.1 hypothetical protein U5U50_01635 [Mycoplasma sp. 888]
MVNLFSHNEEQNQKRFESTTSSVAIAAEASTAAKYFYTSLCLFHYF